MRALLIACSCLLITCQREDNEPKTDHLYGVAIRGVACHGWYVKVEWWVSKLERCVSTVVRRWTADMPDPHRCEPLAVAKTRLTLPDTRTCATKPGEPTFDALWPIRWSHQIIGCPELGPIVLNAVRTCARDAAEDAAK